MSEPSHDDLPSASVVVVTPSRASYLRQCLDCIQGQTVLPIEVVVVDSSPDDQTYHLVFEEYPGVRYVRNPAVAGTTGMSRNLGLGEITGEIVAFVDEDAFAQPDWLEHLRGLYVDPSIGGVGGQVKRVVDGEEAYGVDGIGRLRKDGTLSGNFSADPGRVVEVDYLLTANMSFRTSAVIDLGGIRDGYPGTNAQDGIDLAFRVRAAGWKLLYNPAASVDQFATPYPEGQDGNLRRTYYGNRNHAVLLARTIGFKQPYLRRYLRVSARASWVELSGAVVRHPKRSTLMTTVQAAAGSLAKAAIGPVGAAVGVGAGYHQRRLDEAAAPARSAAGFSRGR